MAETPVETQDSPTPAGATGAETTTGTEETPEQKASRLERENAELKSQKDELHGRAKRAEEELKRRGQPAPREAGKETSLEDIERRIEEKAELRHEGYSREEIAEAEVYAKAKGLPLSEAVKTPFVKAAIDGLRAEKRSKDATPASSRRTAARISQEELGKMKPTERKEKLSPEQWRESRRKQGRSAA